MTKPTVAESADRDARINELRAQGLPYRAIATEVGCAIGTVSNVIKKSKPTEPDTAPPGANTKPLPDTVTNALAKVHQLSAVNGKPVDGELTEHELDQASPEELFEIANRWHVQFENTLSSALRAAINAGRALIAAKKEVPRGEWMDWVAAHFKGSHDLANKYMTVARNQNTVLNCGADTSLRGALAGITAAKRADREPKNPTPPQPPANVVFPRDTEQPQEPLDVEVVDENNVENLDADADAGNASIILEQASYLHHEVIPYVRDAAQDMQRLASNFFSMSSKSADNELVDKVRSELLDEVTSVADMLIDTGTELRGLMQEIVELKTQLAQPGDGTQNGRWVNVIEQQGDPANFPPAPPSVRKVEIAADGGGA